MSELTFAEKLVAAGKAIGTLEKDGHNDFHDYDYVTEASVKKSVGRALREVGLFIVHAQHTVLPGSEFGKVLCASTVQITDGNGNFATGQGIGSGSDKGDKAAYKAMAGGLKYALTSLFLVPTSDDPEADADAERKPEEKPAAKRAPKPIKPAKTAPEAMAGDGDETAADPAESRKIAAKAELAIAAADSDSELKEVASSLSQNKKKLTGADFDALKTAFKAKMAGIKSAKE